MVNHIDREEVRSALEGRWGRARRKSLSTGFPQLYSALPVYGFEGNVVGVFRLSLIVPSFWQRISPAVIPFLLIAVILIMAALGVIFFLSNSLSGSITRLVGFTRSATGKPWFGQDLPPVPGTETTGKSDEFLTL